METLELMTMTLLAIPASVIAYASCKEKEVRNYIIDAVRARKKEITINQREYRN